MLGQLVAVDDMIYYYIIMAQLHEISLPIAVQVEMHAPQRPFRDTTPSDVQSWVFCFYSSKEENKNEKDRQEEQEEE